MFLIFNKDLINFLTFLFLQYVYIKKFRLFNRFLYNDEPLIYSFHSFEYMMTVKYILDLQISYYFSLIAILVLFGFNYIFVICFLQELLLFPKIRKIFYINY
jgi:hypothetical protein